jgi:GTP-binding protein
VFEGMGKKKVTKVLLAIFAQLWVLILISATIADFETPGALPEIRVDEPTMNILFGINDSPFFGKDGKFVTSRHLRDRL